MSELLITVRAIDRIIPHQNADAMEIAVVGGWETCVRKGQFRAGDKVVFFPPDSVLPNELAERLGIKPYLTPVSTGGGRVRVANLRGAKSYGTIMPCEEPSWQLGRDVAEHYGVTKWEPPVRVAAEDEESPHPAFHAYHDMPNLRDYPDMFQPNELVVATEKIHGTNCRLALLCSADERGEVQEFAAGSHRVRRKETPNGLYWSAMSEPVRAMLAGIAGTYRTRPSVILFGEIFGPGVQDMDYGVPPGRKEFRAFDISVNGKYMDAFDLREWCGEFEVPVAPIIYCGLYKDFDPFAFASGESLVRNASAASEAKRFTGREGIVITTFFERAAEMPGRVFSRAQAKIIAFDYLARRGGTEFH